MNKQTQISILWIFTSIIKLILISTMRRLQPLDHRHRHRPQRPLLLLPPPLHHRRRRLLLRWTDSFTGSNTAGVLASWPSCTTSRARPASLRSPRDASGPWTGAHFGASSCVAPGERGKLMKRSWRLYRCFSTSIRTSAWTWPTLSVPSISRRESASSGRVIPRTECTSSSLERFVGLQKFLPWIAVESVNVRLSLDFGLG